jgi:2'-5' RNA ligase
LQGKTRLNYLLVVVTTLLTAVCSPEGKARIAPARVLQAHNLKRLKSHTVPINNPHITIIMEGETGKQHKT